MKKIRKKILSIVITCAMMVSLLVGISPMEVYAAATQAPTEEELNCKLTTVDVTLEVGDQYIQCSQLPEVTSENYKWAYFYVPYPSNNEGYEEGVRGQIASTQETIGVVTMSDCKAAHREKYGQLIKEIPSNGQITVSEEGYGLLCVIQIYDYPIDVSDSGYRYYYNKIAMFDVSKGGTVSNGLVGENPSQSGYEITLDKTNFNTGDVIGFPKNANDEYLEDANGERVYFLRNGDKVTLPIDGKVVVTASNPFSVTVEGASATIGKLDEGGEGGYRIEISNFQGPATIVVNPPAPEPTTPPYLTSGQTIKKIENSIGEVVNSYGRNVFKFTIPEEDDDYCYIAGKLSGSMITQEILNYETVTVGQPVLDVNGTCSGMADEEFNSYYTQNYYSLANMSESPMGGVVESKNGDEKEVADGDVVYLFKVHKNNFVRRNTSMGMPWLYLAIYELKYEIVDISDGPQITTHPVDVTVEAVQTATFSVTATGEGLTYQWQVANAGEENFTDIPGATEATYSITAFSSDNGKQYRCVVKNAGGTVTSNAATLTITAPIITTYTVTFDKTGYPEDDCWASGSGVNHDYIKFEKHGDQATVVADSSVWVFANEEFTVTAEGATIVIPVRQNTEEGAGGYEALISEFAADTTIVVRRVNNDPEPPVHTHTFTEVPAKAATCTTDGNNKYYKCDCGKFFKEDKTTETTVAAETIPASHSWVTDAWEKDATNHWHKCSKCTEVKDKEAHVDANTDNKCDVCEYVKEVVVTTPVITKQPQNVSVKVDEKATFSVTATGDNLKYQWQINRNDGKGFVNISGATSASYATSVVDMECNGFKYRCIVSNEGGSVTTNAAILTVTEKTSVHTHSLTLVPEKAATCTAAGNKAYYTCSGCDSLFADANGTTTITAEAVKIAALGHDWSGEWTIIKEATKTEDGKKRTACVNGCGQKKVVIIPATGTTDDNRNLEKDAEVEPDVPIDEATLNNSKEELLEAGNIFTDTEKTQIANGADARVWLEISKTDESAIASTDKAKIEQEATNIMGDNLIITYFDADLFKRIGTNEKTPVPEPGIAIKITIKIPNELLNSDKMVSREYKIIRLHKGQVEVINGTFDSTTGEFTFESDKFSSYAIVYKDAPVNADKNDNQTSGGADKNDNQTPGDNDAIKSENDIKDEVPKTGDSNTTLYLFMLMLVSGLGVVICSRKKDFE